MLPPGDFPLNKFDICIIGGAGRAGLPISIAWAAAGQRTVVCDINEKSVAQIANGEMPFREAGAADVLSEVVGRTLHATTDPQVIAESDVILVVIGTPVDEFLNPSYEAMLLFFEGILPYLRQEQLILLRSTVFPGSTDAIRDFLHQRLPGIQVCFCPERIAEGKAMEELHTLPQIIAGYEENGVRRAAQKFQLLTRDILFLKPLEAELAKIFTNSWRYLQFAIANQFYMIAEEYGADFHRIYKSMTHNYRRTAGFPGPGFAAGPCLFKDTMQLSAFARNTFFLGHSAMLVNEGLPDFLVREMKKKYELRRMKVGILGMAFKADSDDNRQSLSYKLRKLLRIEAAGVACSDPYVDDKGFLQLDDLIDWADILVIGAPHRDYRQLDIGGKEVVDIWNIVPRPSIPDAEAFALRDGLLT